LDLHFGTLTLEFRS